MADNLVYELANLHEEEALTMVKHRLAAGDDPLAILDDVRKAMELVGKRYEEKEYFIPELVYSGEILKEIHKLILPSTTHSAQKRGQVIIGTVAGDIHDIGKNIVTFMLDTNGFEVLDLGVDVPPQAFIERIRETKAPVVMLSGMLTLAFESMKETIEAIHAAGLSDQVKICIGGGQTDDRIRKYTGADDFGTDAMTAVSFAKRWIAPAVVS